MKVSTAIALGFLLVASGCSSESGKSQPERPVAGRPALEAPAKAEPATQPVAPNESSTELALYCQKAEGLCALAASAGEDVFAHSYREHCSSPGSCERVDGAYCIDEVPGSSQGNPLLNEQSKCFASTGQCEAFRATRSEALACAPMSALIVAQELYAGAADRARHNPTNYHCSNAGMSDGSIHCFDDYWSCAYRRHQWMAESVPCEPQEQVSCYSAPVSIRLGLLDPVESCYPDSSACQRARTEQVRAEPAVRSRSTECEYRATTGP